MWGFHQAFIGDLRRNNSKKIGCGCLRASSSFLQEIVSAGAGRKKRLELDADSPYCLY